MHKTKRNQTVGEEIANSVSHGVMAIFGIVALILLLVKSTSGWMVTSSLIFGLSMIMLYLMSTLYHSLAFTKAKTLFKTFDHLSIYILIGGTFAPALLLLPSLREATFLGLPNKGLVLFIIQWILIIIGIVFKSIWVKKYSKIHTVLFLLLGWSAVIFIADLYAYSQGAFWFILLGGVAYSIGVIFYALSRVKYFHFIWHLWVALGTILQFIAIYGFLM